MQFLFAKVEYSASGPIVTDIEEAMNTPENILSVGDSASYGDVDAALASSDRVNTNISYIIHHTSYIISHISCIINHI